MLKDEELHNIQKVLYNESLGLSTIASDALGERPRRRNVFGFRD